MTPLPHESSGTVWWHPVHEAHSARAEIGVVLRDGQRFFDRAGLRRRLRFADVIDVIEVHR
jgi:hypothetical protein